MKCLLLASPLALLVVANPANAQNYVGIGVVFSGDDPQETTVVRLEIPEAGGSLRSSFNTDEFNIGVTYERNLRGFFLGGGLEHTDSSDLGYLQAGYEYPSGTGVWGFDVKTFPANNGESKFTFYTGLIFQ